MSEAMQTSPLPKSTGEAPGKASVSTAVPRLSSRELMRQNREVEIDHEGRIYRLRITQLNKLILTA
jgi:hemin uptake protein HemP